MRALLLLVVASVGACAHTAYSGDVLEHDTEIRILEVPYSGVWNEEDRLAKLAGKVCTTYDTLTRSLPSPDFVASWKRDKRTPAKPGYSGHVRCGSRDEGLLNLQYVQVSLVHPEICAQREQTIAIHGAKVWHRSARDH